MATKVQIPSMGESVTEATILRWIKQSGEAVKIDDPLCELETDKANVELPSPVAGVLETLKKEGDKVKIGEVVAQIDEKGTATAKAAPAKKTEAPKAEPKPSESTPVANVARPKAAEDQSPSVRRAAKEHGVDTAALQGSGPRGRIVKEDVLAAVPSSAQVAHAPEPVRPPSPGDTAGVRRVSMTKIRKKIAERLVQAQHTAAMLTTFNEVDMSEVLALREKYKARFTEQHGVPLGLMSFFARACVVALHEFPALNAFIESEDIVYHDFVNLGIAVSTERGLVVPVLRNVEALSFAKIESEIKRMATSAREGKLGLQELGGGTFTITNGGVFGSLLSTPILNLPQSGILGLHAIQKRPIAVEEKIEIRPMMYVALSYDHRLVDGRESVSFLVRLKNLLEDPSRLMLEV